MDRKELTTICVMIPSPMRKLIEQFVSIDTHTNLSEFVRDALRQKLQKESPQLYRQLFSKEASS